MFKRLKSWSVAIVLVASPAAASAAEISTHVLDLTRGVGGSGVPVSLNKQIPGGRWVVLSRAVTDANGRVRSFGDRRLFGPGTYKLQFDMSRYPQLAGGAPFFPEIDVVFRASDGREHYHVPVVVSPYGYSTYRGN